MITTIRMKPIEVLYLTGNDAKEAREIATGSSKGGPCFTTTSMGDDGFAWDTCEDFEADFADSFGEEYLPEINTNHGVISISG